MAHRIHLNSEIIAQTQKQRMRLRLGLIALTILSLAALLGAQSMQTVVYIPTPTASANGDATTPHDGSVIAIAKCPDGSKSSYTQLSPVLYKNRHGNVTRYWVEPTSPGC